MIPHFGVAFDPVTNLVTKIVHIDYGENDSEENIKFGLRLHCPPGNGMIFIPKHRIEDTDIILRGLGVKSVADR